MTQPRNFGFGEDEQLLRNTARKFLADHFGIEILRRLVARDHREAYESDLAPAHWDEKLWKQMVDLGWTAAGGAGSRRWRRDEDGGGGGAGRGSGARRARLAVDHDALRHLRAARGVGAGGQRRIAARGRRRGGGTGDHRQRRVVGTGRHRRQRRRAGRRVRAHRQRQLRPGRAQGFVVRRVGAQRSRGRVVRRRCRRARPVAAARPHRRPDARSGAPLVRARARAGGLRPCCARSRRRRRRARAPGAAHHRRGRSGAAPASGSCRPRRPMPRCARSSTGRSGSSRR